MTFKTFWPEKLEHRFLLTMSVKNMSGIGFEVCVLLQKSRIYICQV